MNLSLKQKAFLKTVSVGAIGIFSGAVISLLVHLVPLDTLIIGAFVCLTAFLFKLLYDMNLNSLQYQEKLKEMNQNVKNTD